MRSELRSGHLSPPDSSTVEPHQTEDAHKLGRVSWGFDSPSGDKITVRNALIK